MKKILKYVFIFLISLIVFELSLYFIDILNDGTSVIARANCLVLGILAVVSGCSVIATPIIYFCDDIV